MILEVFFNLNDSMILPPVLLTNC